LGRPRCGWVDNIKMDLREIGWYGVDWIDVVPDRDEWRGSCDSGNEPSGSKKISLHPAVRRGVSDTKSGGLM
jgi:hypothetical protein